MNQESSRSHAIFTITIEVASRPVGLVAAAETDTAEAVHGGTDGDSDMGRDRHIRVGKLNFVDLAGSERQVPHLAALLQVTQIVKFFLMAMAGVRCLGHEFIWSLQPVCAT